jgi:hypothetical protein
MPDGDTSQYRTPVPKAIQQQARAAEEGMRQLAAKVRPQHAAPQAPAPQQQAPDPQQQAPVQTPAPAPQSSADEVAQLKGQIEMLRAMVANQGVGQTPAPQVPAEPQKPKLPSWAAPKHEIGPVSLRELSDEQAAEVRKLAEAVFAEMIKPYATGLDTALNRELPRMHDEFQRSQQSIQQTRARSMLDVLTDEVPNWREINGDPQRGIPPAAGWYEFLATTEPMYGQTYQELLDAANTDGDGRRVAAVFKQFLNQNQAQTPTPPQQASGQPPEQRPAQGLEQWVAPGTQPATQASTGAASGQATAPAFRESDIQKFYMRKARGDFKGRDDEFREAEAQIMAAIRANRVVRGQ